MIGDILQPTHLIFILVVALLVLGPKRLPEVGRALGRGMRDFRNAVSGEEREQLNEVRTESVAATTATEEQMPASSTEPVAAPVARATAPAEPAPPPRTAATAEPAAPAGPSEQVR